MCGITGIFDHRADTKHSPDLVNRAVEHLKHRGPDHSGIFCHEKVCLGHTRLSVIDITEKANQPFTDSSGRYTIVYNGETYNFNLLRQSLESEGVTFKSQSDTEVVLELFKKSGKACVHKLNGFFAFAIYDAVEQSLFLARDRFGIKPLYYFSSDDFFAFASELTPLLEFGIPKELNRTGVGAYFQLNYFPFEHSAVKNVLQLERGGMLKVLKNGQTEHRRYYPHAEKLLNSTPSTDTFDHAKKEVLRLLTQSVQQRMVADVPVGCFLSGGVDSSIIAALAARENQSLQTFSVGFKDQPYLDESEHAELVAKHLDTQHETFQIQHDDLLQACHSFLENLDEPFADSSALAVHYLCEKVRSNVKVALSGDGADELFSGYYKHAAFHFSNSNKLLLPGLKLLMPLLRVLPKSRDAAIPNFIRQLYRMAEISALSPIDKYWALSRFQSAESTNELLLDETAYQFGLEHVSNQLTLSRNELKEFLFADFNMVLEGDMLVKVDRMSMKHGLEVRTPFLDHHLVEYVFSLPDSFKMNGMQRKYILRNSFEHLLPSPILQRSKKGFEVPLRKWFLHELKDEIENKWLSEEYIQHQQLFDYEKISLLLAKLKSANPGDTANQIWNLVVFNAWWFKFQENA